MSDFVEAKNFIYNAPGYCNLNTANTEDDLQVEEYFNFNHENVQTQYEDVSSDEDSKQPFYTPLKLDMLLQTQPSNMRKSLSMGNLLSQPKPNLGSRPISKERLNMLSQPKRTTQGDFVSSAELITKFHQKTPKRFRTTSVRTISGPIPEYFDRNGPKRASADALLKKMTLTVPQSPALATRSRSRPTMYVSQDIREKQELEDMKKFKIKAMPIPKTNYGPVIPVKVEKKTRTVVQPFNLTKVEPKKVLLPESNCGELHAKSIPKNIVPKNVNEIKLKPLKAIHTTPAPFSFQTKQDEMLKKRDQLITKVMEEEKKRREFHAQPIPKSVFKSPMKNSLNKTSRSKENIWPRNNSFAESNIKSGKNDDAHVPFKAKPAYVLKKLPYVPKLNLLPLTAITAFNLNTERRVAEREAYEMKMREKEEAVAEWQNNVIIQEGLKEKAAVVLIRKQMEIKANPIRHFKPLKPILPKPLTIPEMPNFVIKNKIDNQSD